MGGWLQEYINQLKELWEKLNKRARLIIGLGVGGVIIALILLIMWSGEPGYQPLFSQLNPKDADSIVQKLEENNVSYQLADNGTTILVPATAVHKTRLEMAGEGLPTQGVVGFEIFDKSQFGTTDFDRKVNFYRALGGELSRSIQAMDAIEFAKVQITAPEESLFIEKEKPAEASVLLKIKPDLKLTEIQVKAISNLVASSVQGLATENVTIIDTAGNLLAPKPVDEANGPFSSQLTINQFEIEQKFEEGLKSDLKFMLTKVLGPDNFTVQVNVRLNFDQREVESKIFTPVVDDQGIVRSQEEHTENYQGDESVPVGVPGTTSNIPQYQSPEEGTTTSTYEKSDIITNYEINEKIERHVYSPGSVDQISVAVMVNDSLEEEDLEKIKNSVQAAIGFNPERDDQVTVVSLPFDTSLREQVADAQAAERAAENMRTYIYTGLIIFILLLLFVTIIIFRRNRGQEYGGIDFIVGEELEEAEREIAATELTDEEKKRQKMKKELEELVAEQPEGVAQVLKSWLLDD